MTDLTTLALAELRRLKPDSPALRFFPDRDKVDRDPLAVASKVAAPANHLERDMKLRNAFGRLSVTVAALLLSACASAPWSPRDVALEASFQAVNAIDGITTARIAGDPSLEERVPFTRRVLGPNPSSSDAALYFATAGASHWLISRALPPKWRPWFQAPTVGASAAAVSDNCRNGLCR